MPHLELNGTKVHFQVMGQGEGQNEGTSVPVVMLHGLLIGNLASWYFSVAAPLSKNHEVILYDLRGHGLSEKTPTGYDLVTMVADLEALIAARAYKRVILVGHSYGALIALQYALRHPSRVSQLVMVEAPLPPSRGAQMDTFLGKSPEEITAALPVHLQELLLTGNRQAQRFLERLQFLLFETALLENLKAEPDVPEALLSGLNVPTLLVYGKNSQLVTVGERLARELPEARLEWLDGGHYLPSEKPRELAQLIQEFLQ